MILAAEPEPNRRWHATVVLLLVMAVLSACTRPQPYLALQGRTMGTTYHIRYQGSAATPAPEALQQRVDARLQAINRSMSTYQADSTISAFNQAPPGTQVPIDTDFAQVLALSQQVHQASNGAFDPGVGSLVNLWGFGWPKPTQPLTQPPTPAAIAAARGHFGQLPAPQDGHLHKPAPMRLDFSAIAKGYGVDAVAEVLREQGVQNYMVEIGGEVATRGQGPQGERWRIGIEAPGTAPGEKTVLLRLHLGEAALATSGNYRNFVEIGGIRYTHIIDPATGYPVREPPLSVSVLAPSAAWADAWATAFMVLDEEQGLALAEKQGLAVYWVYGTADAPRMRHSSKMVSYLEAAEVAKFDK